MHETLPPSVLFGVLGRVGGWQRRRSIYIELTLQVKYHGIKNRLLLQYMYELCLLLRLLGQVTPLVKKKTNTPNVSVPQGPLGRMSIRVYEEQ